MFLEMRDRKPFASERSDTSPPRARQRRVFPKRRVGSPARKGGGAKERRRLFAACWIANGGNGKEAARWAGYEGSESSLEVTGSRLLRHPQVRSVIEGHVQRAERAMAPSEVIERLSDIARLLETGMVGAFRDLEPRDKLSLVELARRALIDLARIHGLMRDQPPSPPPPNVTVATVLRSLSTETLRELNDAMEAAARKVTVGGMLGQVIPVEPGSDNGEAA
jgi:hypothetical protein